MVEVSAESFTLLSDQPSREIEDPLGFDAVAGDLTTLLLASRHKTPLTIGVVGDWGSGKSSLMRRLDAKLAEVPASRTVWFNAWTAERGEALEGLVKSVLDQLDPRILRRVARNRNVVTGLRIAVTIVAGFFRAGGIVDTLWEHARVDPKTRNELRDLLTDAMKKWVDGGPRNLGGRLLVVFVDDLDRCNPDTVFQIFEAIKLYLDAPGIAFVVGFDDTVISEAILEHKRYSKSITGRIYLDKIVQIEVSVPEATQDQMARLVGEFALASGTERLLDEDARALIVDSGDRNPRRLKRFVNTFVLEQRLDRRERRLDARVLIKTLLLQTYFRDFARLFRDRADPISEFFEYLDVRDAFLGGEGDKAPVVREFLTKRGIPMLGDTTLADIEARIPEVFPKLALNQHFVSLVRGLHAEPIREDVRSTLEESQTVEPSPQVGSSAEAPRMTTPESAPSVMAGLEGLRLLWISADPDPSIEVIVSECDRAGATTTLLAGEYAKREAILNAAAVADVVIWSIGVEGHADRMFVELEELRARSIFEGPVVFYGEFASETRQRRAEALGATVLNSPRDLLFRLGEVAGSVRSRPRRGASTS